MLALAFWAGQSWAFGNAQFTCKGSESKDHWFKGSKKIRDLEFELLVATVDGEAFQARFLGRTIPIKFSARNLTNSEEKFDLYSDQVNRVHKLTYETANKTVISAVCQMQEYK